MTHTSIAACLGEDFLAQALHREYRHVPGVLDVAGIMTWDDLNQILAAHRLEPPRMRLSRDGETLLVGGYTTPVATRRHTVWHRLHPAELHARLQEGASLALDSVDELHPPLARLCEAIERDLRTRVQANLYASWTSTEGFGVHWDDHDTVIVQLDGAKRWRIYGTTRPFPLYRDIDDPGEAPTEPVADLVLWPGDVLYVPRGVWHAVSADQGTRSLHVTCGLQTHTATDLMAWVSEQLLTHEDWRRDLPLLAAPDVQADAMDGMRKRLAELLDDPGLLARYRAAMDGQAVGRMVPSLPHIDTVPVDGGLRVRLTTARAPGPGRPPVPADRDAGYFTAATGADAVHAAVLTEDQAMVGHSLAPQYVRWQIGRNHEHLGRERLDLVLLHNPERAHPGDRLALHHAMRDAFVVLEEAVAAGHAAGYGIATWAGLEEAAFTVGELLALAAEAAGGQHHLVAVQMPVSLVMMTPIAQALHGRGPLPAAAGAGLRVMASAPLHGGELPGIVDQELADLIRPGLTPAQACILAVASCPGVTDVLLAASGTSHWRQAAHAVAQTSLTAAKLREITGVLAAP
ncbi:aldo/keto reductase [Streptomyces naphthomycinicus]|uniref:aldo/keto reductase n=1 Tax=Streptomyces naphthomycinicus TaxID=2872625 RepID=UPI001CEC6654|nr:aldo/keto reductase [Streptomyces sp. TML10]